jgi:hypothetical protein
MQLSTFTTKGESELRICPFLSKETTTFRYKKLINSTKKDNFWMLKNSINPNSDIKYITFFLQKYPQMSKVKSDFTKMIILMKTKYRPAMVGLFTKYLNHFLILKNSIKFISKSLFSKTKEVEKVLIDWNLLSQSDQTSPDPVLSNKDSGRDSRPNRTTLYSESDLALYKKFKADITNRIDDVSKLEGLDENEFARFFSGYSYDREQGVAFFLKSLVSEQFFIK